MAWQIGGMLRMDPRPFTLKQLFALIEGHDADQYQTVALLAGICNRLGDKSAKQIKIGLPKLLRDQQRRAQAKQLGLPANAHDLAMAEAVSRAAFAQRG